MTQASLTLYMFSLAYPKALSSVPYSSSSFSMTLLSFLFPLPLNCLSMQTMFCSFTLLIVLPTSLPSTLTCGQSFFCCYKNHYISTSQSLNTCFYPLELSFKNIYINFSFCFHLWILPRKGSFLQVSRPGHFT